MTSKLIANRGWGPLTSSVSFHRMIYSFPHPYYSSCTLYISLFHSIFQPLSLSRHRFSSSFFMSLFLFFCILTFFLFLVHTLGRHSFPESPWEINRFMEFQSFILFFRETNIWKLAEVQFMCLNKKCGDAKTSKWSDI